MTGMGKWTAKNHCRENFLTEPLQYPQGMLKKKVMSVTIPKLMYACIRQFVLDGKINKKYSK